MSERSSPGSGRTTASSSPRPSAHPLNRHNVFGRSFEPLFNKAGLPHPIRFHDLRHTCATLLCPKNVNPKLVEEMLGHANISQTMVIYSHVLPNMQDEAAAASRALQPNGLASKSPDPQPGLSFTSAFPLEIATKRSGETRNRTGDTMIFSLGRYVSDRCQWLWNQQK